MLRVYLDGNIVDEPIGIDELVEHLYYAESLSSYVLEIDGSVTFSGSEHDYLRGLFDSSVCTQVLIRIVEDDNYSIDFDGIINVADIEFFPDKKFAVCEIQNNNITAKIENNRSIEAALNVGRSKNDVDYTVTIQNDITIYDPTGANTITRDGIRIYDAFSSIVRFVTDNEIGFVSDYFDPTVITNEQAFSVLMNGSELRTGAGFSPTISFADLFDDMNSLENLALAYEDGNIRIEDKEYFKQQSSSVTFDNVRDLSQALAVESLYAVVKFGSNSTSDSFTYLQDIRFVGMGQEEYHLGGQCNTDTQLDLRTVKIITDPNIIQDVIPSAGSMGGGDNDAFDDDVLIIHCDSSNDVVLTPKPASATDFYFNDRYSNRRVALRWLGQIPQSIYAYLGASLNQCYINQVANDFPTSVLFGFAPTQESPAPWNDANNNYSVQTVYFPPIAQDGYLEGGGLLYNYQMSIGIYTAPANGVYSFEFNVISDAKTVFIHKMYTDTLGGAADGYAFIGVDIGGGLWQTIGGATFYLNAGEYVGVRGLGVAPWKYYANSTFRAFDPNGGAWQTYNSSNVYQIENKATYPIPIDDWKTIKLLPFQSIVLKYQTGQTNGWLKDISRNIKTGTSEVVLLGKQ